MIQSPYDRGMTPGQKMKGKKMTMTNAYDSYAAAVASLTAAAAAAHAATSVEAYVAAHHAYAEAYAAAAAEAAYAEAAYAAKVATDRALKTYWRAEYKRRHGRCEDAPCCGCCGPAESDCWSLSSAERRLDGMY